VVAVSFNARLVFALSGLLLIGAAFAMRRQLGRAGAMTFAALLVLSPSVAYFSRTADGVVPAQAFAVLALALFLQLVDEPGRLVAAGLGAAVGLSLASGETALMTALFMLVALAIVGLTVALAGARVRLQVRVWWTRRKALFLIAILVAAVVSLGCVSGFFTRSPLDAILAALRSDLSNLESSSHRGFRAGLDFYLPILSLYEFLVVLLALIGALGVLTLRIRSRLATGALVWSALAVAFYLWTPARSPVFVLQMIVPMALLGAFVIGYLHHTAAWSIVRYPVALLVLLTLCVQVANNFVWYAPDASQAPWARTALLYWTEPATTLQTPVQCARVAGEVPPHGASVFFAADSPVLRWYLRALAPAATAEGATAIVGGVEASLSQAQGLTTYEFELSDTWHPAWWSLSPRAALNYLLSAHAWTPLDPRRVTIAVRPIITVAPTVILAPVGPPAAAEPAASATPSTEASPAPSASATPAPLPAADNHPLSTPASTAASTPAATPVATPTATAAATPTAVPAATPSAIPARSHAATASGKRAGRHSRHAR
jgi:predicted membrane-bound mannosyltransferase